MNWFKKQKKTPVIAPPEPVTGTAGSLREFVYLDEVSVYSLTSAPDLPPPVTMSESATNTSGEALKTQVEAGAPGLGKVSAAGELNSGRTGGKEVQRQFNIQSQFARLHKMYRPTFLLTAGNDTATRTKSSADLAEALNILEQDRRAVREADVIRGALTEIRIALRPHPLFDITAFTRTAGNLIQKYPGLLGIGSDVPKVAEGLQAGEFFAELMEDLVPIEGRATSYGVINDYDGGRWIVDLDCLKDTYSGDTIASEPLRVVGVAETDAFWKDTRRILHSDSDYDVLGRVARTGLQNEWTPIKVVDTFKRVIPSASTGLLAAVEQVRNIAREEKIGTVPGTVLALAGTAFHQALADHHMVTVSGPSVSTLATLLACDGDLKENLTALNRIADDFYEQNAEADRDSDVVAGLRQDAWRGAQVLTDMPAERPELEIAAAPKPTIELEFIAMYW